LRQDVERKIKAQLLKPGTLKSQYKVLSAETSVFLIQASLKPPTANLQLSCLQHSPLPPSNL